MSKPTPASALSCGDADAVLDTFIARWKLQSRNSRCSEDESVADYLVKGAQEIKDALRARAQPCRCGELRETLKSAHALVCSACCPSVKRTGEDWTHSDPCRQITEALAATAPRSGES